MAALLILTVLFALFASLWKGAAYIGKYYFKSEKPHVYSVVSVIALVLLFSWDWIPAHIYYFKACQSLENPITIYKSAKVWQKEVESNPDLYRDPNQWKIKHKEDLILLDSEGYALKSADLYEYDDTPIVYASEPPRDCRRLNYLRELSHENNQTLFQRNQTTCYSSSA